MRITLKRAYAGGTVAVEMDSAATGQHRTSRAPQDGPAPGVQRAAVQRLHQAALMETRELYEQKFEAQIYEWSAGLAPYDPGKKPS